MRRSAATTTKRVASSSQRSIALQRIFRSTDSPALFPEPELRERLAVDYEAQCLLLFSAGAYPSFDEVLERFEEIRKLL